MARFRRTPEQRLTNGPACYAELAIKGVSFQINFVTGKALNTIFRLRQFTSDALAKPVSGAFVTEKLNVTLEGKDVMTLQDFIAEIERGFDADIRGFGETLKKSGKTKAAKH
jgi:hypothetical protein